MKFSYFIIIIIFITFCSDIMSQSIIPEIDKDEFRGKNEADGFRDAWKEIKSANLEIADGLEYENKTSFERALDLYLKAYKYNPNNAELNYLIGLCYIKSILKTRSIDFFENAYKTKKNVAPDILFLLGRSYHLNYEFDKAIDCYSRYAKSIEPSKYREQKKKIEKHVNECNFGKELTKKKVRVFIDNIGTPVNTRYPEFSPLINADESVMIFTTRRPRPGEDSDIDPDEDIYIAYNDKTKWTEPESLGKNVNTKTQDATVGFSPDGTQLFIYKATLSNGGDIYVSNLKGSEWSKPDPLPDNINTKFHEPDASISPDGNVLYFVSNNSENNFGKHDIFVSYKQPDGQWGNPQNIGGVINTEYDDRAVFMHPDGRTLFFSSEGHNSMGGFDVFKSTLQDDLTWSKPENMGYPINTPDDDIFLVISGSGKHGYYSSIKEEGYGGSDIYKITFLGPEKPLLLSNEDNLIAIMTNPVYEATIETSVVEIKTMRLTILKGTVKDADSLSPIESSIEIIDNDKNQLISTFKSNSVTGKYLISLPSGKNYGIAVTKDGYLFHSENVNIPPATAYQEIVKDILLSKIRKGAKIVLNNIFFDFDKATLRNESKSELERILEMLAKYPKMRIEISGHTDNVGSHEYNVKLSMERSKAVVDYLIKNKVAKERLEYKGYAFEVPIATNDTEEGRQLNRRVEFKIISEK